MPGKSILDYFANPANPSTMAGGSVGSVPPIAPATNGAGGGGSMFDFFRPAPSFLTDRPSAITALASGLMSPDRDQYGRAIPGSGFAKGVSGFNAGNEEDMMKAAMQGAGSALDVPPELAPLLPYSPELVNHFLGLKYPAAKKPTADIQEYEYDMDQRKINGEPRISFGEWRLEKEAAGATQIDLAEKAGLAEAAKVFGKVAEEGMFAEQELGEIDILEDQLGSLEDMSGFGRYMAGAAGRMGIDVEGASEAQAAQAIINKLIPRQRVPGTGATSDYEMRTFRDSVPNLMGTPEGNKVIMDTMRAMAEHKRDMAEIAMMANIGQISPMEAIAEMKKLGDPLAAFKQYQAARGGSGDTPPPPAGFTPVD